MGILRKHIMFWAGLFLTVLLAGRAAGTPVPDVVSRLGERRASEWGTHLPGVFSAVLTSERVVALTFDACDARRGGYDAALIAFLRDERVPATLFLNARWIEAHPESFEDLASDPLFELGGHGTTHRPLSVTGRSAYGIRGTRNAYEAAQEVCGSQNAIAERTGRRPLFFRSGTAHYDDVALAIVEALGYRAAGFSVNGDDGATLNAGAVERRLLSVKPGDVVLCHMNRPDGGTAEGVRRAVPKLRARGFRFVRLSRLAALAE